MQNNLQKIVETFPKFKEIAALLNKNDIHWALAAGTATYYYAGKYPTIDEIDVLISQEDKEKVEKLLKKSWEPHSSNSHKAINIKFDDFDFFTNCVKIKNGQQILNYLWTNSVDSNLKTEEYRNILYKVLPPTDIVFLKIANPRECDFEDIKNLKGLINKEYLLKRLKECQADEEVYTSTRSLGLI